MQTSSQPASLDHRSQSQRWHPPIWANDLWPGEWLDNQGAHSQIEKSLENDRVGLQSLLTLDFASNVKIQSGVLNLRAQLLEGHLHCNFRWSMGIPSHMVNKKPTLPPSRWETVCFVYHHIPQTNGQILGDWLHHFQSNRSKVKGTPFDDAGFLHLGTNSCLDLSVGTFGWNVKVFIGNRKLSANRDPENQSDPADYRVSGGGCVDTIVGLDQLRPFKTNPKIYRIPPNNHPTFRAKDPFFIRPGWLFWYVWFWPTNKSRLHWLSNSAGLGKKSRLVSLVLI